MSYSRGQTLSGRGAQRLHVQLDVPGASGRGGFSHGQSRLVIGRLRKVERQWVVAVGPGLARCRRPKASSNMGNVKNLSLFCIGFSCSQDFKSAAFIAKLPSLLLQARYRPNFIWDL